MKIIIIFLIMFCSSFSLFAEEGIKNEVEESQERPKIGLVLSGGGARGIAHIGVLRVLEELELEPDYITGTSMGSVIGALYAIGYNADQLEDIVSTQDWKTLLMDKVFRKDISIEEKKYDERYVGKLPIINYKIVLPVGIVSGQRLSKLFADLTISVQHINDFSELRIPFRCIATDIETGEAVVLDSGFLPEAMRTSMSIPSAFTPVKMDGKLLVDGGLARNLPVIDALDMGADIIIAVDVSSKLYNKDQLISLVKIMEQSVNFRGLERSKEQHKLCDLIIFPDVADYGMVSFDACDSLIVIGEKAARESYNELRAISDEQKKFQKVKIETPLLAIEKLFVNKIKVIGLKTVSKNLVIGKLNINENSWVTIDKLSKGIDRLYGSQFFERVSYRIFPRENGIDLEIRIIEKYKHVLNFSFQYNSDTKSAILLNETARNLFFEGSRLIWDVKLSENPAHALSYFVHTGWKPGFGIGAEINYEKFEVPIHKETGFDHYDYTNIVGKLVLQTVFSNSAELGVGFQHEHNIFESTDIDPPFKFKSSISQFYGFIGLDTLNRTVFPQSGIQFRSSLNSYLEATSDTELFSYKPFYRLMFDLIRYKKFHENVSIYFKYQAGFIAGNFQYVPANYHVYLGGIGIAREGSIQFYGLDRLSVVAKNAAAFGAGIQINVWKGFYLIPRWNIGKATTDIKNLLDIDDTIVGAGLTGAFKTPFGAIEYTVSKSSENSDILHFWSVGYKF